MKSFLLATTLVISTAAAAVAQNRVNAGQGWTCSASNIVYARYSGGSSAFIHLSPYRDGKPYEVQLSKNGRQATGQTSDGTRFVCTKN